MRSFHLMILGFLRPTIFPDPTGNQEVFVDGGVIYNYAIHCYDGERVIWTFLMYGSTTFLRSRVRHNTMVMSELRLKKVEDHYIADKIVIFMTRDIKKNNLTPLS